MPDYDLSGLSSRSFEQLIQALAVKVLGPGVGLFGDGPDGGREAVFEGTVPFPADTDPWSGYIVVQAKFRQVPKGAQEDLSWLIEQTTNEFKKYQKRKRRVRKPDYYILATNVVLTSVAEVGGKDRFAKYFVDLANKLGIKGFRIWDGDQIRAYLDNAEDIRRAYVAWITPGDVLAKVIDDLQISSPDFMDTVATYLQKELMSDTFVNLEQAGHNVEARTLLAKVFVDLPTSRERYRSPPQTSEKDTQQNIVQLIVEAGNEKLDPDSSFKERGAQGREGGIVEPGRFIILGGPGQGKSTVSQLVAQLYRLTFLRTRQRQKLSSEVRDVLDELEGQCTKGRIALPLARRFPLRVVLSKFAVRAGLEGSGVSLLAYLANHISMRTDRSVSPERFRTWLAAYPWILILDGLDEVPGSSNRDEVLRAVKEFLIDVAGENADILIVATTRPQGYNNDFSPEVYQHWWLVPLSVKQAMHYAARLVEERYRTDEERRLRVLDRLDRATENPSTERLMQSPLQITILAALLEQIGHAPRDRWRLFHEYYAVIFRREMDKPTEAAEILSNYRLDVDMIHRYTGLLLQILSEEAGGTEAHLSLSELRSVIEERLATQGHEGEALTSLTAKILAAAAERLVFIVGLEEGRIGFEIRSLQEFMAGEALASGEDDLVRVRLRRLGELVHWRNVFLFVAGRCFAEREYLSESIHLVCCQLNDAGSDQTLSIARSGSRLALELLEDGAARAKPGLARLLVREALHFLEIPAEEELHRLAQCYEEPLRNQYEDTLKQAVCRATVFRSPAWALLLGLAGRQIGWAESLAEDNWPEEPKDLEALLRAASEALSEEARGKWLHRLVAALPKAPPEMALEFRGVKGTLPDSSTPKWFNDAVSIPRFGLQERSLHLTLSLGHSTEGMASLKAVVRPVKAEGEGLTAITEMPDPSKQWRSVIATAKFASAPAASTLARALQQMANTFEESKALVGFVETPWPLASILAFASSGEELLKFSRKAEDGEFGDLNEWIEAERRWLKIGVCEDDLWRVGDENAPFDHTIAQVGIPHGAMHIADSNHTALRKLIEVVQQMPEGRNRQLCARMILYSAMDYHDKKGGPAKIPNETVQELITSHDMDFLSLDVFLLSEDLDGLIDSFGASVEQVMGRTKFLYVSVYHPGTGGVYYKTYQKMLMDLSRIYNKNRISRKWMLRPMATLAVMGLPLCGTIEADLLELSDEEKAASIILRVIQGNFDYHDACALERRAVRRGLERVGLPGGEWRRSSAIGDSVVAEKFLHTLWVASEPDERMLRASVVDALNGLIGRRKSGLLSSDVWEPMGLPGGLREVGVIARERFTSPEAEAAS